jgi:hypothetical protein
MAGSIDYRVLASLLRGLRVFVIFVANTPLVTLTLL